MSLRLKLYDQNSTVKKLEEEEGISKFLFVFNAPVPHFFLTL